jgi:serine/threonine protein kinase
LDDSDAAIRAEVDRLLRCHDRSGILDLKIVGPITDGKSTPAALQPGDLISNRFRIQQMIGSGGMGEVYQAEDLVAGQIIALKTIRSELADDTSQTARFRRELLICRKLTHPNVCRVYGFSYTQWSC